MIRCRIGESIALGMNPFMLHALSAVLTIWIHLRVITEEKARKLQQATEPDVNNSDTSNHASTTKGSEDPKQNMSDFASLALGVVERKLSAELSVESQISQLILDATNPENVATIFSGEFVFGAH